MPDEQPPQHSHPHPQPQAAEKGENPPCTDCEAPPAQTQDQTRTQTPTPNTDTSATAAFPENIDPTAPLPRVTITYCTQCRWMLRAAYYAQELLSTFAGGGGDDAGTGIGEVALRPGRGGVFVVDLTYIPRLPQPQTQPPSADAHPQTQGASVATVPLWNRKTDGGFPETKVLKQRVRDWIDPARGLGHSDRGGKAVEGRVAARPSDAKFSGGVAGGKQKDR